MSGVARPSDRLLVRLLSAPQGPALAGGAAGSPARLMGSWCNSCRGDPLVLLVPPSDSPPASVLMAWCRLLDSRSCSDLLSWRLAPRLFGATAVNFASATSWLWLSSSTPGSKQADRISTPAARGVGGACWVPGCLGAGEAALLRPARPLGRMAAATLHGCARPHHSPQQHTCLIKDRHERVQPHACCWAAHMYERACGGVAGRRVLEGHGD
jgi:hypothetical protein